MSLSAGYWDKNEVFRLLGRLSGLECFLGSFVFSHYEVRGRAALDWKAKCGVE